MTTPIQDRFTLLCESMFPTEFDSVSDSVPRRMFFAGSMAMLAELESDSPASVAAAKLEISNYAKSLLSVVPGGLH